jgi:hypothetical protein
VEKVTAKGASSRDEVLREVAAITETDYFRTLQEKACGCARQSDATGAYHAA